jgi:hypothetical protein
LLRGTQLSELAAAHFGDRFGLWAIVKETSVDDLGLIDFYTKYFTFDIYRDEQLSVYSAMGNRSIFAVRTWNPVRWYRGFRDLARRMKDKQIDGNYAGEGIIQGGLLFFDRAGTLRFAYEEEIGDELSVGDVLAGLRALEQEAKPGHNPPADSAEDEL